ncbi:putative hemolysin [Tropicimonas marinistellae]|uniref:putative hemolysin n=1 Tax=Tropicimonas marinistellae TaxID=1739787 RepID=UPI000835D3BA|nr:DUF333 domain-containing protein [Tropicimonas marinistellae]
MIIHHAAIALAATIYLATPAISIGTPPDSSRATVDRGGLRVANATTVELPNPAAVFCVESGGQYEIRTVADGSQSGVCILPGGEEADAWEFFREKAKE